MAKVTEKENYMRVVNGEDPVWIPRHKSPGSKWNASVMVKPSALGRTKNDRGEEFDIWGVEYVSNKETGWFPLPKPGKYILDDITKWRDVIHAPDLSNVDWQRMAENDLSKVDRENKAVLGSIHTGYFQGLMNFMGFEEGLCAMAEEPEEVKALMEYMCDFYCEQARKLVEYYKPDLIYLMDDTATAKNPFLSVEMYHELIKPYHMRECKIATDAGIPIIVHNCGRCEDFIEDWMEMGVRVWEPAQICNDLLGIKKRYGRKLVLAGCWDSQGIAGQLGVGEDILRAEVRKCVDTYAPGGGFMFWGNFMGDPMNPDVQNARRWIDEEYETYGRSFYETHGV